jgi:hypothetical protein
LRLFVALAPLSILVAMLAGDIDDRVYLTSTLWAAQ